MNIKATIARIKFDWACKKLSRAEFAYRVARRRHAAAWAVYWNEATIEAASTTKTFEAKDPARYVQILTPDAFPSSGGGAELHNTVVGYRMVVDFQSLTYDSFIAHETAPNDWIAHRTGKPFTPETFWREVQEGHLVAQLVPPLQPDANPPA